MENYKQQPITETLEENYMPYIMSVIMSRAIPEIDGFKPSHRKLLYTMYKKGLLNSGRTKSANIVGETMKLNPHGDAAIYETMVRLTRAHEALLHPFVDSKGNFGRHYSRDMAYAAARYTEAKLEPICAEVFRDIDKDVVDFVPNYDGETTEPTLLPVSFPNILVNPNQGIAVGMASSICSFNLSEICETAIALMKDPQHDLMLTLTGPDFPTGGQLIYDADALRKIYSTGVGSIKVRASYRYDKKNNSIEVYEIPYSTTLEAIIEKIVDLVKAGKLREISDVRDLSDKDLRISIELKRGTDPDKLMRKLFKLTTLEDSFSCNFNVLIAGTPRVMGVAELLGEWIAFRSECIKRGVFYDLNRKKERLHLLEGLRKILVDIDKAVRIVRQTEEDSEVVPNLMIGFGIDKVQAEFVADIKLRNFNKEYILNKTDEIDKLRRDIEDLQDVLDRPARIKKIMTDQLREIAKKYGKPRRTRIIYADETEADDDTDEQTPDYPVTIFVTKEGYFKKVTAQSLRMSGAHKFKEGDELAWTYESKNSAELLVFTDKQQVYKTKVSSFEDTKISLLGDYLPQVLGFEADENVVYAVPATDYSGHLLIFFKNGKCAKVPLDSYATKLNRRKLINAYSAASGLVGMFVAEAGADVVLTSSNGRILVINSDLIPAKTSRNAGGVTIMALKSKNTLERACRLAQDMFVRPDAYRVRSIPASGLFLKAEDKTKQ